MVLIGLIESSWDMSGNEGTSEGKQKEVVANPIKHLTYGGERGIRTLDTDLSPYASLAGKCLRPLGQLSVLLLCCEGVTILDYALKINLSLRTSWQGIKCLSISCPTEILNGINS